MISWDIPTKERYKSEDFSFGPKFVRVWCV